MSKFDPVIKIEDVHFSYEGDDAPALDGVSLEIDAGSFVAVLGHNGSGKSTLAKLLNGILLPSRGSVTVYGMDTNSKDELIDIRRTVGMVFQNPDNQLVASVVEDDVAFAPENLGFPPNEIRQRVDEALKTVGMYEYRLFASHLLSGGQKQRVAIAGALAMHPKCLVLDEPTAMLDPSGRQEVMDTIKRLSRENGMTVLLITHHMDEAAQADRVFVMSQGQVVREGDPRKVFSDADGLQALQLSVPETTELLFRLKNSGLPVSEQALSIEECAGEIVKALRNQRKG